MEEMEKVAIAVIKHACNNLTIKYRFLSNAVYNLNLESGNIDFGTNGIHIQYNSIYVIKQYKENQNYIMLLYIHSLFHCIYRHVFGMNSIEITNKKIYHIATDMVIFDSIIEIIENLGIEYPNAKDMKMELKKVKTDLKMISAKKVYNYIVNRNYSEAKLDELCNLFYLDSHEAWEGEENQNSEGDEQNEENQEKGNQGGVRIQEIQEQWEDISKQMQMDLESFSKEIGMDSRKCD